MEEMVLRKAYPLMDAEKSWPARETTARASSAMIMIAMDVVW